MKLLPAWTLLLLLTGCAKEDPEPEKFNDIDNLFGWITGGPRGSAGADRYLVIHADQHIDAIDPYYTTVLVLGRFKKNEVPQNAGSLQVDGVPLDFNGHAYTTHLHSGAAAIAKANSMIGKVLPVSAGGTGLFGGFEAAAYLPKKLLPEGAFLKPVYNDSDYTLQWIPDTTGPGNLKKVQIRITHLPGYAGSGRTDIGPLDYITPDNGSFTLPERDLARFPDGAYITIAMAHGCYLTVTGATGDSVALATLTTFTSSPRAIH
ncbi:MAG TPA: hypothetical protein VHK69_06745 [Chitinophagaceae bacterium]|nr:hypothetical protein [Chitinophagaceae bacterium]